jgi:hypothetical protein
MFRGVAEWNSLVVCVAVVFFTSRAVGRYRTAYSISPSAFYMSTWAAGKSSVAYPEVDIELDRAGCLSQHKFLTTKKEVDHKKIYSLGTSLT